MGAVNALGEELHGGSSHCGGRPAGPRDGVSTTRHPVVASRLRLRPGPARCRRRGSRGFCPGFAAGECHPITRKVGVEGGFPDRRGPVAGAAPIGPVDGRAFDAPPRTGLGTSGRLGKGSRTVSGLPGSPLLRRIRNRRDRPDGRLDSGRGSHATHPGAQAVAAASRRR